MHAAQLLRFTLERRRGAFCDLMTAIVNNALIYRRNEEANDRKEMERVTSSFASWTRSSSQGCGRSQHFIDRQRHIGSARQSCEFAHVVSEASIIRWLLMGDPAIRWQVMRDLTHEPDDVVAMERSRVGFEGWGRALLDRQAPEGWWVRPDDEGWMATTDALVLLCTMGLDPSSDEAHRALARVKAHLTFERLGSPAAH